MMPSHHQLPSEQVLSLPELVSLIGTCLEPPDLFSCVRVSRLWNTAMVPSLWHTIDDSDYQWPRILKAHDYPRTNNGKGRNWIKATFTKYGKWIRVLNIHWRIILEVAYFGGSCTNIQTLFFSNPFKNRTTREEQDFRANRWRESTTGPDTGGLNIAISNIIHQIPLYGRRTMPPEQQDENEREATQQEMEWNVINLFLRLVRQNPDISGVRLCSTLLDFHTVDFLASLFEALVSTRRLQVLDNYDDCNDLGALLARFPHIRYYGTTSSIVSSSPFQTTLPSLQALRLQGLVDTRLFTSLLQHLPNLHSLWIGGFQVATPYCKANFIHDAMNNIKPISLQLLYIGRATPLEDEILRATIPCVQDLRVITAGSLEEATISTLVESCPQLESVTLSVDPDSGRRVPRNALSYFLEGCPRLRVLDASRYNVKATRLEGRTWVCRDLEVLKCQVLEIEPLPQVEEATHSTTSSSSSSSSGDTSRHLVGQQSAFLMRQQSRHLNHQVYNRLAGLTKLKTLVLWLDPVYNGVGSLEWTLETGLGQLSVLKELEVFGFDGMTNRIGEAELTWVAQSWPRLRLVYGLQSSVTYLTEVNLGKDALRAQFMALRPDVRLLTFLR
ncbi:MAG: hypothetical protein J3R72DRAFT_526424 [Linnemannia gamsii]|nr:MAG: hypothetical protein J3R72DRAFT_526424 [Linnemannia gamsii]